MNKIPRIRRIHSAMMTRCYNTNVPSYARYGNRGITVCDEWKIFSVFKDWAMKNGYKENLSIDRIDNNGNYCPENCRWATRKEQANNQRSNVLLTAFGETKNISQWAEDKRCKVNVHTLRTRINDGWDDETAISKEKISKYKYLITAFGETKYAIEWSKDPRCSVSHGTIINRFKAGLNPEDCISMKGRNV